MGGVDSAARLQVSPDSLTGLADLAAASAPDPAAMAAALAAGAEALAGLASGAALAEVGRLWERQTEALSARRRMLARDVARAGAVYGDVDSGLAS